MIENVKKYTKTFIKQKLIESDLWLVRGLLAIYRNQTDFEQINYTVRDNNGIGFNKFDAELLSGLAKHYLDCGFFTQKQIDLVRKKMLKYSGQLTKIANKEI